MAVQRYVQQYQSSKGLGVIAEGNPTDIGTFVVDGSGLSYGVFCAIGEQDKQVTMVNGKSKIVGVIAKQLDRVSVNRGMTQESAETQAYEASQGKSVAVIRNGYVNVLCESEWTLYDDVYIRLSGTGVIGSVAANKSEDKDYFLMIHATFSDSNDDSKIAKIYVDLRIPVAPNQSLSNIWTTN